MKLAYLLQQHLSPRAIQANGFTSFPISVIKSIPAGCKASVALARGYLKPIIKPLVRRFNQTNINAHVDDTSMQSTGKDYDEVLEKIIPAVARFAESVVKLLKLMLSPKAVVTASEYKLALILQKELQSYGLTFRVDQQARDVGNHAHSCVLQTRPFGENKI